MLIRKTRKRVETLEQLVQKLEITLELVARYRDPRILSDDDIRELRRREA